MAFPTNKVIYYDLETCGLKPKHYTVSLGYVYTEDKKEIDRGILICNPDYPISEAASKTNGFTNESVKNYPLFVENWVEIEKYYRDSIWIGYNNQSFDDSGLELEFMRYCIPMPHHWSLDVMKIAKAMVPQKNAQGERQSFKLISMCDYFNIDPGDANFHAADFDIDMTKKLFSELWKRNVASGHKYDHLFIPVEVQGEYSGCNPPCKHCEDFEALHNDGEDNFEF